MKKILNIFLISTLIIFTSSCCKKGCTDEMAKNYDDKAKKDDGSCILEEDPIAILELNFDHNYNGNPIMLNSATYINANLDTFEITALRYIVSNIKLYQGGNAEYVQAESYHLIDHDISGSSNLKIKDIPAGTYDSITFSIGVDSLSNNGTALGGDLYPGNGMHWPAWDDYRFIVLEAAHKDNDTLVGPVIIHVGGNSNYKTFVYAGAIDVQLSETTVINYDVEISNVFTSPNTLDFSIDNNIRSEVDSKIVADNYESGVWNLNSIINP